MRFYEPLGGQLDYWRLLLRARLGNGERKTYLTTYQSRWHIYQQESVCAVHSCSSRAKQGNIPKLTNIFGQKHRYSHSTFVTRGPVCNGRSIRRLDRFRPTRFDYFGTKFHRWWAFWELTRRLACVDRHSIYLCESWLMYGRSRTRLDISFRSDTGLFRSLIIVNTVRIVYIRQGGFNISKEAHNRVSKQLLFQSSRPQILRYY